MKNYKKSKAVKDEYYAEQKRDKVAAAKKEGKQDSTKNCTLNLTSMRSTDAMSFSVSAIWRTAHCIMPLMFSTWARAKPTSRVDACIQSITSVEHHDIGLWL